MGLQVCLFAVQLCLLFTDPESLLLSSEHFMPWRSAHPQKQEPLRETNWAQ